MKKLSQWLAVTAVAAALVLSTNNLSAQDNPPGGQGGERGGRDRGGPGGGGGDPAQFQQMRLDRFREAAAIKDDTEWKAIEPLVAKVMDAQRDALAGFGRGGFGRGGQGGGGGGNNDQGGGQRRGGFGQPSPEAEALQKAIESKASKDELKSAMAKVRTAKKDKEAKLTKAQEDLKKVLSTEQEAVALTMGLVQ